MDFDAAAAALTEAERAANWEWWGLGVGAVALAGAMGGLWWLWRRRLRR